MIYHQIIIILAKSIKLKERRAADVRSYIFTERVGRGLPSGVGGRERLEAEMRERRRMECLFARYREDICLVTCTFTKEFICVLLCIHLACLSLPGWEGGNLCGRF